MNVLSGIVSTIFCAVAIAVFHGGTDATFQVVLDIAISTTLLSYILIFPAVLKLRRTYPEVHRPFVVPFAQQGCGSRPHSRRASFCSAPGWQSSPGRSSPSSA